MRVAQKCKASWVQPLLTAYVTHLCEQTLFERAPIEELLHRAGVDRTAIRLQIPRKCNPVCVPTDADEVDDVAVPQLPEQLRFIDEGFELALLSQKVCMDAFDRHSDAWGVVMLVWEQLAQVHCAKQTLITLKLRQNFCLWSRLHGNSVLMSYNFVTIWALANKMHLRLESLKGTCARLFEFACASLCCQDCRLLESALLYDFKLFAQ